MVSNLKWIVDGVKYIEGYKLLITFRDGSQKIVNLENELYGEIFEPLKSLEYFKNVQLEGTTIAWDNGADIAPEWLYDNGVDVSDVYNQDTNAPTTGTHS